jgi:hypothetical protein
LHRLRQKIDQVKAVNATLTEKWYAYQLKMHKMRIETRINKNRKEGQTSNETLDECQSEHAQDDDRIRQLCEELEAEDNQYRLNVEKLTEIIDGQRRKIVAHLMGRDEEEEEQPEEGQRAEEEQHSAKDKRRTDEDEHPEEEQQPEF